MIWYVLGWLLFVAVAYLLLSRLVSRRRVEGRLQSEQETRAEPVVEEDDRRTWLGRRLGLAGLRGAHSTEIFLLVLVFAVTVGVVLGISIMRSDPFMGARQWLTESPGGGMLLEPVLAAMPWVVGVLTAVFPILWVRARRRERVRQVEEDLPITLELLAAQARAGLGFEAALNQVLRGGVPGRPLAQELRAFQNEMLAGIPRSRALRRLGKRLDVPSVSVFVSALVHAEQVGGGLSSTLRMQADELRLRRRARAFAIAQGLPAKVVVPLVVCFLPGIFAWSLGPAIYQFAQLIEQVLRTTGQE